MTQNHTTRRGEITIRIATPEDAESIFKLRLEALTAHPEAFAADVEMTQAKGVQAWAEQVADDARDQSGVLIIACAGEEVLGMTGIGRGHWPKTRHSAIIWGVYVKPSWRGLRIAEAMMNECIAWAQGCGIVLLKLGVVTDNDAAVRCYQRCGFSIYGTEPKSIFVNGSYYDEFMMARLI